MPHRIVFTLLLSLTLSLSACDTHDPASLAAPTPTQGTAHKYLALGDSYTIGQSVDASQRYPVLLAGLLRKRGIDLGEPTIIARTGWTTRDLLDAIASQKPEAPFELVTLLIGVNNQFQHRSIDEFRTELVELLKQSITLAGGKASHVVALSIPDWGVTPFGGNGARPQISEEIDAFNRVISEECARLSIVLVDVTPISRTAPGHAELIANDGLHPSGKMYALWADAALESTAKAVKGE